MSHSFVVVILNIMICFSYQKLINQRTLVLSIIHLLCRYRAIENTNSHQLRLWDLLLTESTYLSYFLDCRTSRKSLRALTPLLLLLRKRNIHQIIYTFFVESSCCKTNRNFSTSHSHFLLTYCFSCRALTN